MKREEYLDHLLDRQGYWENQLAVDNDEITASVAAAQSLARLQRIDVPADFAYRLERSVRAYIRTHHLTQQNNQTFSNERIIPITPRRHSANARHTPKRRAWPALLGTAAMLVLAFVSLLVLSTHYLSGTSNQVHQLTSTVASNTQNHACPDMGLLQSALADLRTAVNDQQGDNVIQAALKTVTGRTNDCRNAVAAVPVGSERAAAQQNLNDVLAEEEQTIRQLLKQVDWPMRLRFTQQLGNLGDAVPTVTHVTVNAQPNGTFLITLTGTNFAPQAGFIIDGLPKGGKSQVTAEQLVITLNGSEFSSKTHAIGVLNPDGTAAQFVLHGGDDHNGSRTPTSNTDD